MKKITGYLLVSLLFSTSILVAQDEYEGGNYPGSIQVDAGEDTIIGCSDEGDNCVELTATFLETFETDTETYTVSEIPYDPPFAFDGLANQLDVSSDDTWSPEDTLPFDFCFFGSLEQDFIVGSNGVISFQTGPAGGYNAWPFTQDLPNTTEPALSEANVFTPVHDIYPNGGAEEIAYEVIGSYPNRVLVVSFYNVNMFSCTELQATHMAVFYEFSNIVDIYIQDKPVCEGWNDGNAAVGIQNNSGTAAYVPPGRNTSDSPWEAYQEAWRFAPDGQETYEFEWVDQDGNVIGDTATIEVCPDEDVTTYTARVTYTNTCNGDVVLVEDEVDVIFGNDIEFDLGEDMVFCEDFEKTLVATPDNLDEVQSINYAWYKDGVLIEDNTGSYLTVTEPGTYTAVVAEDNIDCETVSSVTILAPDYTVEIEDDLVELCEEESYEIVPEIQGDIDVEQAEYLWNTGETTPTIQVTESGTYSVEVAYEGCVEEATVEVNVFELPVVSVGEDFEKCDDPEDIAVINAEISNIEENLNYVWYRDGGVIDGETAESIEITEAGIYTVEVYQDGAEDFCMGTDNVQVSYYANRNCIIPEGISPNGDGMNESLDLTFLHDNPGIEKLSVFNRNGIKIYEEEDYTNQWSGQTDNDDLLPVGTYYYVLNLQNEPEKTGFIYVNY